MNSYPIEFLSHPQPLMFVGGLGRATSPPSPSLGPSTPAGRKPSNSELPLMSPEVEPALLPTYERDGEFETLARDLRSALAPYTAAPRVWVPETERRDFRVVLVDKGVRLPVRKLPADQGGHSPLSPLTPSSPLHPDGLIAPVWVRKHTELVPSVFVLFLRLYETPARGSNSSPLGGEVLSEAERQREREADEATVREIAERRRRLGERGIKLTVVLMASAATLDADGLDARLSAIRRASQLSAKASLFVLTPVKASELPDFVMSLFGALYDPAMEYYAAHGKRVRRKRGRVPSSGPMPTSGTRSRSGSLVGGGRSRSSSSAHTPLSAQGWMIRYDWKAGWLAEVRGELDLARRHYEDCWNELARMFGSTSTLPPRTKRWAEAKVLADCLAVRICKLQLYENAGTKVLVPFFVHLRRFADLSRGWGIGEDTFEFWSWVARQYRIFGEVLEIALANGFDIPPMPIPSYPAPPTANVLPPAPEEMTMPNSSSNPLHVLHPPGFYFYTAASCSIERKARYEAALASERAAGSSGLASAPGFANEKSVNHTALIVDLLSKASALLEGQGDLALYVAFRMAQAQTQAGLYEPATKTLTALSERYNQSDSEAWALMAAQVRRTWYECAQATGDVETAVRLLAEMLADLSEGEGEEGPGQDDLLGLLSTTKPSSDEPIALDAQVLDVRAGFRRAEAPTGAVVAFQLAISAPEGVDVSRLPFSRLRISISDGCDVLLTHADGPRSLTLGAVSGTVEVAAPLNFATPLILTGTLASSVPAELEVLGADLTLATNGWNLSWRLAASPLQTWTGAKGAYVPLEGLFSTVVIAARGHALEVELEHAPVGFVGEALSIIVRVRSEDERKLKIRLSVLLQPGDEPDGATISVDSERSDALLKDIPLTTISNGDSTSATITLIAPAPDTKLVDISILSTNADDESDDSEIARTAAVPVVEPFALVSSAHVGGGRSPSALLSAVLSVPGPRGVVVTGMEVVEPNVALLSSSLAAAKWPQTWDHTSQFGFAAKFAIPPRGPPSSAGLLRVSWHPSSSAPSSSSSSSSPIPSPQTLTTDIPFPHLHPPPPETFVTASLTSPAAVRQHRPFSLALSLANAHPDSEAWLTVQGETADAFVWSGPRGARVPVQPGSTTTVELGAVPVGASGWQGLPHVSVWLGDGPDRREVRVAYPQDRGGSVLVQP